VTVVSIERYVRQRDPVARTRHSRGGGNRWQGKGRRCDYGHGFPPPREW